ncbi:hypothetical protein GGI00_004371 [Coemansia sp. RSA 2681]|nr:hypothetical protein GGI00_004371 [Coemansia sp. RSA 2681]
MSTKAERERAARIEARKKEAEKKNKERDEKKAKLKKRLDDQKAYFLKERVRMLDGAIIVEVLNTVQAKLAQAAGFNAICPFNTTGKTSIPTYANLVTSDPRMMRDMMDSVLIPVIARVRTGHVIEAKMAEHLGAGIIDEADYGATTSGNSPMAKGGFGMPVMSSVTNLKECFQRIDEGASMLRTKEMANRNFSHTISMIKSIYKDLKSMDTEAGKTNKATLIGTFKDPLTAVILEAAILSGKLPVPLFACGAVCTPNDVAMAKKMGCGVIISNIAFKADNPRRRLKELVRASKQFGDIGEMVKMSTGTNERVGGASAGGAPTGLATTVPGAATVAKPE